MTLVRSRSVVQGLKLLERVLKEYGKVSMEAAFCNARWIQSLKQA